MENNLRIYLLVRDDLKMGIGKIAVQCGHAVQELVLQCPKPLMKKYKLNGCTKICLKIENKNEMQDLQDLCKKNKILHYIVVDAGQTQISSGSETVIGIGPIWTHQIKSMVQELKLL